jgi:hypothetical protein
VAGVEVSVLWADAAPKMLGCGCKMSPLVRPGLPCCMYMLATFRQPFLMQFHVAVSDSEVVAWGWILLCRVNYRGTYLSALATMHLNQHAFIPMHPSPMFHVFLLCICVPSKDPILPARCSQWACPIHFGS